MKYIHFIYMPTKHSAILPLSTSRATTIWQLLLRLWSYDLTALYKSVHYYY